VIDEKSVDMTDIDDATEETPAKGTNPDEPTRPTQNQVPHTHIIQKHFFGFVMLLMLY
jgi:hypothetical protein